MTTAPATESRELVLSFFPKEMRSDAAAEDLASLIAKFLAAPDLSARLTAFVEIKDWTASSDPSPMGAGANRLETFLDLMESQTELRTLFHQAVREILGEIRSVELFAEAGLHPREGLWTEALRRLTERILPSAREDTDLGKLINRLYPTSDALDRVIQRTDESFERIAHALSPAHDASAWVNQDRPQAGLVTALGSHRGSRPVTCAARPKPPVPNTRLTLLSAPAVDL